LRGKLRQVTLEMLQRLRILGTGNGDYLLYALKFTGDLKEGLCDGLEALQLFNSLFGADIIIPKIGTRDLCLELFYSLLFCIDVKDNP
jgi:hypothetical protein